MAKLFAAPFYTALDNDGNPISGATLEWFLSGTSTPSPVYTSNALLIEHTNPVVADSDGRFPTIYLADLDYKAFLKDELGSTIRTIDPIHGASAENAAKLNEAQTFTKTQTWTHGADVASAAVLTLGDGNIFDITGTTAMNAIATKGKGTVIVLEFDAALTLTHHATDLVLPASRNITTAAGDIAIFEEYATGDWRLVNYQRVSGASVISPLPRGYLGGAKIANNSIDATNDIDVLPTSARDDLDGLNMVTTGTSIVSLDTNGAGGLDTGSKAADTWYHLWMIGDSTGVNQPSFVFSTSVSAPTLPSGWDRKRLLDARAVLTDSTAAPNSAIIAFSHEAEEILWLDPPLDIDLTAIDLTTAQLDVMTVPTGIQVKALLNGFANDATAHHVYISSPDVNDEVSSGTAAPLATIAGPGSRNSAKFEVRTDTSGQIRSRSDVPLDEYRVVTLGWAVPSGGQGAGAVASLVLNAETYGAVHDGVTDDTVALQAAIDAAEVNAAASPASGPITVFCPAGKYLLGQIVWKDRVHIDGDGISATEFFAKNNLDDHLFITPNFAALTNTDICLPSEGVISNIKMSNCRIEGNKANQTAGDGVRIIAKNPSFQNVVIQNCKERGLYSELGQQCPVNDWSVIGAGNIDDLRIIGCDGYGWLHRGPHDIFVNMMKSYLNGLDGIRVENNGGSYNPTLDFNHIHAFANTGFGVYVDNASVKGAFGRFEDNQKQGLYFESAQDCQIGDLSLINNCQTSGDFQCVIDTDSNQVSIANLQCRTPGRAACGGLQVLGDNCHINGTIQGAFSGGNSTGVGLDVANIAQFNEISVTIQGFSGVGGIGLRTGNTAGINHNTIKGTIQNCDTGWNNVTAGIGNQYRITGTIDVADTKFSGVGPPASLANTERWEVHLRDSGGGYETSRNSIRSISAIDLTSTTAQDIVVTHNLLATPVAQNITAMIEYSGADVTHAVQFIEVRTITSTTITIRVKLGTAGTGTAHLLTDVRL